MQLSVAERREIFTWARFDTDFRERLEADPKATVEAAIKRSIPDDTAIELIDEGAAWSFVLVDPASVGATMPEPFDVRTAVENDVYEALRDDPAALAEVKADPVAFLRNRFHVDVHDVNLLAETPGEMKIVLPGGSPREELDDAVLDRISGGLGVCMNCNRDHSQGGGNDPNSQCGKIMNPYNNRPAPR